MVAGLDLGDKHSFVCLIDLDGKVVERKKPPRSPAAFERYFGAWAGMRVIFEASSHANWVYRLLERLRQEPLMADTHRLALITQSLSKDDRTDAERLAELGLLHARDVEPGPACFAGDASGPRGVEGARGGADHLAGVCVESR